MIYDCIDTFYSAYRVACGETCKPWTKEAVIDYLRYTGAASRQGTEDDIEELVSLTQESEAEDDQ